MATRQQGYEAHDLAKLFPLNEGKPLWDLSDDIKVRGQDEPIVLYEGKILDGRRRELACIRAGVTPKYVQFKGKDPLGFVVAKNLHRRHLGEADRALIAAKVATMKEGRPPKTSADALVSQKDAAELLNVSVDAVKRATTVQRNGTPELQEAVREEAISLSDAATVAKETPAMQRRAVNAVRNGKATTAQAAVKEKPAEAVKDAEGSTVPAHVTEAFTVAKDMEAVCREIDALIRRVEDISKGPGGRLIRFDSFRQQMKDAKGNVWANRPTHICPYCNAVPQSSCDACKGQGWTAKHVWEQAPGKNKRAKR